MANAKATKISTFSQNDEQLARYIELEAQIKQLSKEKSAIAAELKERGSHATRNFLVTVKTIEYKAVPDQKTLISIYGEAFREHLVDRSRTTIQVAQKAG